MNSTCVGCGVSFKPSKGSVARKYHSRACYQENAPKLRPVRAGTVSVPSDKRCITCGQVMPLHAFTTNKKSPDGLQARCRSCCRVYRRNWSENQTPEQRVAAKFRMACRNYKTEPARLWQLFDRQNGACAICGEPLLLTGRMAFNVDHDHDSGEVRGLLCHACNLGIGCLHDSTTLIEKALIYLRGWEIRREKQPT